MSEEAHLYNLISKDQLTEILEAFAECTGLKIQVIDEKGTVLQSSGNSSSFCLSFSRLRPSDDSCLMQHLTAAKRSVDLGESYIFACHANLNHITFPFLYKGAFLGAVLVGPFLMEKPDSLLLADIAKRYNIPMEKTLDLYDDSTAIPCLQPSRVTHISRLLTYSFNGLLQDSQLTLLANRDKIQQQSRINESIQMYKNSGEKAPSTYPYEKEKELLNSAKNGNIKKTKAILNDLLGYVLFSKGNDLDNVKARAMELSSLLSRVAIEGGAQTDSILKINNRFLMDLSTINNMDNLCLKIQEIVVTFDEAMFHQIPGKNGEIIRHAFSYISDNYSKRLTLEEVAEVVHLNPSYFSTLFKKSSGSSFREYLNMVRIEASKHLLESTSYSLIDIAIAVGFEDQSYFTKVFKKYTGLTPKQYRQ
ncbi:MAG: PocR ligand-binding domain-containing protein [Lachnospiraceae bacterium]|nr:PocR ligand-binding domain-containing protein [Lachnospiraceae bacterium]